MRAQTLRSTADNDGDGRSGALFEDVRAGLLAHAAYPQREDDVSVYWHGEVGGEREEMGRDAGKRFRESRG
jgi:hypothetical protein